MKDIKFLREYVHYVRKYKIWGNTVLLGVYPYVYPVRVEYTPSTEVLQALYQQMQSACAEVGAAIVQIKEMLSQYFVFYGLKTDADFAYIQFFVTEN